MDDFLNKLLFVSMTVWLSMHLLMYLTYGVWWLSWEEIMGISQTGR